MKSGVALLKSLIREVVMAEEARTVADALHDRLALAVFPAEPVTFVLYDPVEMMEALKPRKKGEEAPVSDDKGIYGVIMVSEQREAPQWGAHEVNASAAKGGYGPMLYDIAMAEMGGLVPDRATVTPSAKKVWSYYKDSRSDVEKKLLDDRYAPKTTTPEDDTLNMHRDGDKNPLNYAYFIEGGPNTAKLKANHEEAYPELLSVAGESNFLRKLAHGFFDTYYRKKGTA